MHVGALSDVNTFPYISYLFYSLISLVSVRVTRMVLLDSKSKAPVWWPWNQRPEGNVMKRQCCQWASSVLLVAGYCWLWLITAGYCWLLVCWLLLLMVAYCWLLLVVVVVGCCWLLLVIVHPGVQGQADCLGLRVGDELLAVGGDVIPAPPAEEMASLRSFIPKKDK